MNQLDLFSSNTPQKKLQQEDKKQLETPVTLNETDVNSTSTETPSTIDDSLPVSDTIVFVDEESEASISEPSTIQTKKIINNTPTGRGRKSIQAAEDTIINIPTDEVLFQKQYYAISEVADMFGVNTSLIRFWENEFDILQPRKNKKGDRFFSPTEIKKIELIHHLLRNRKFTIPGAKEYLKKNKRAEQQRGLVQSLQQIKSFLLELKATIQ